MGLGLRRSPLSDQPELSELNARAAPQDLVEGRGCFFARPARTCSPRTQAVRLFIEHRHALFLSPPRDGPCREPLSSPRPQFPKTDRPGSSIQKMIVTGLVDGIRT